MTFDTQLASYADLLLSRGLNIKPGDKLIIKFNAQQLPLVRLLTEKAYQAGASDIIFDFQDDELVLARYLHSSKDAINFLPKEQGRHKLALYQQGYAQLTLIGANPHLLKEVPITTINKMTKNRNQAMSQAMAYGMANHNKWLVAAAATSEWAQLVYPSLSPELALGTLWQVIFAACYLGEGQLDSSWQEHRAVLETYQKHLNRQQYVALHFSDKTTDLTVGLAKNHYWQAGKERTTSGETFISNLPVEELWTMPNKYEINGRVSISKPFSFNGITVQQLELVFKDGQVIDYQTDQPLALRELLASDEGASYLGEVALVATNSPINQTGVTFYQTLFDENAASHLALGRAYESNLQNGETLTEEEQKLRGMNHSIIHEDFMIGTNTMLVEGISADGTLETIMKDGQWSI